MRGIIRKDMVAGWCPLGLIPSWPPRPPPMAYSFFLSFIQKDPCGEPGLEVHALNFS